jgi:membrane protein DedA with SNARE-associated domain
MLKKAAQPLALLVFVGVFYFGWKLLDLPSEEELIVIARAYFEKYGLITVFISAIIEAALMLGLYYPGSLVIFLGVIFAAGNVPKILAVIVVTILGTSLAYIMNYFLGKYGWYHLIGRFGLTENLDRAKAKLEQHDIKAVFGTYWHPNLAAFTSTAAGILHLSFKRFILLSILASICWNFFWGMLAAILGEKALKIIGFRFALVVVVVWIAYIVWLERKEKLS